MRYTTIVLFALAAATANALPARAGEGVDTSPNVGPLPATHTCLDTHIKALTTRLASMDPSTGKTVPVPDSGYAVSFAGKLPDPFIGSLDPYVVFYQGSAANALIARERVGDRVQVCITAFPAAQSSGNTPGQCNPTKDPRGRTLRVYDYRNHFAYSGGNSEHLCGGA